MKIPNEIFLHRLMQSYVVVLLFCSFQAFGRMVDNRELLQPNIILFIADDVSWDDLGCYGNKDVYAPNIDLLALEGMVFDNAYLTTSSCSPSRNSIITGRYPHNTGAAELHTSPPDDMISLPQILKRSIL